MASHYPDSPVPSPVEYISATIANGASLSGTIDLKGYTLIGILMPASWTAANLTFQAASADGGTYLDVYDDAGTEITVTAAASQALTIAPTKLVAGRFLRVRSGTSASAVNQGGERTLTLVARPF